MTLHALPVCQLIRLRAFKSGPTHRFFKAGEEGVDVGDLAVRSNAVRPHFESSQAGQYSFGHLRCGCIGQIMESRIRQARKLALETAASSSDLAE